MCMETIMSKDFSILLHDISQPLMVINTYISTCTALLAKTPVDNNKLSCIMEKIHRQIHLANEGIHEMRNLIDLHNE